MPWSIYLALILGTIGTLYGLRRGANLTALLWAIAAVLMALAWYFGTAPKTVFFPA